MAKRNEDAVRVQMEGVDEVSGVSAAMKLADTETGATPHNPGELRAELERTRAELARVLAKDQPLPEGAGGRIRVVLRHTPAPIKRLVVEDAKSPADAWNRFMAANAAKASESKKLGVFWEMTKAALSQGMFSRVFQRPCPDCKEAWVDDTSQACGRCQHARIEAEREVRALEYAQKSREIKATVGK